MFNSSEKGLQVKCGETCKVGLFLLRLLLLLLQCQWSPQEPFHVYRSDGMNCISYFLLCHWSCQYAGGSIILGIDDVIFFYHFHLDLMHNKCISLFVFWKMHFHLPTIPDPEIFHWPDTTYHILESGLFSNDFVSFPCQVIRNLPVRFESAYQMMNEKGVKGRTFIRCPGGKG